MAAPNTSTAFDRLFRALHPADPANLDGAWYLNMVGTANIIGAGSGGTSQIDDSSFVPGGSSLTPIGGYVGGRSVASGHTAAPAMNASGMLIVAVGAGGAGGGLAQLQVVGSDNSTFQNVGYPSGGSPSINAVPVNIVGGGATNQATVNIGGQPISVVGSVNPHGIFGSVSMVGSVGVTPLASFTVNLGNIPTVNLGLGTVNVGNIPAVVGSVWIANGGTGFASVAVYGSPATPVYTQFPSGYYPTVNIGAGGGGGGGFASVAVYGSPANPVYVQFPSGYFPTVNSAGGGAGGGFASVAVYGSPAMPVYVIGSVNVVNQAANSGFASVAVYGSPANPVYNVGSVNVVNAVGVFGSVNVLGTTTLGAIATVNLGLGTVNIGNAPNVVASLAGIAAAASGALDVDPRANLVATQWLISFGGSGQSAGIAGSIANQRVYFSAYHLVATATVDMQWMSPSGAAITGSFRLLPGAGFALAGQMPAGPVLMGSLGSQIFLAGNAVGNIGGVALGWIGT